MSMLPLFFFTLLTGLSAGTYMVGAVLPSGEASNRPLVVPVTCLALLFVGLLASLAHLGHPEMFMLGMAKPTTGIAREGIICGAFGVAIIANVVAERVAKRAVRIVRAIVGVVALVLTVIQGAAYTTSYAVPAWCYSGTIALFVVENIVAGVGLIGLVGKRQLLEGRLHAVANLGLVLLAAALAVEIVQFAQAGASVAWFAAALVLAVALLVAMRVAAVKQLELSWMAWAAPAACIVVSAIARWGFYAAFVYAAVVY